MSDFDFDFDLDSDEKVESVSEEPAHCQFIAPQADMKTRSTMYPSEVYGKLHVVTFRVEADKNYSKGSTFSLCKFLPGSVRVLGALSVINMNLAGKSATIGWEEFRSQDNTLRKANLSGFGELKKGVQSFLKHIPTQHAAVANRTGLTVIVQASADGKKGDFIEGYFICVK